MKKKLSCILLSILFVLSFSGCTLFEEGPTLTYGDFVYCYVRDAKAYRRDFKKDATGVNILTLTDEGKEKETIIIPESIDGLPVIAIGMQGPGGASLFGKFDNIYIPVTLQTYSPYNMLRRKTIFLVDEKNDELLEHRKQLFKNHLDNSWYSNFFVFESMYSWYQECVSIDETCSISIANLIYIVDGNEYWMDNYEEGEYVETPPAPVKEGYRFEGWYKDEIYSQKWDFSTNQYEKPEDVISLKLFAKFIEE